MKRLIEFPLEDGSTMLIEVDEPEQGGLVKASRPGDVIVKAQQTLERSLEKIKPAAQSVIAQLRKLHDTPDEVQVTFGVKLSADAGAVLASAGAEANYTVTVKWVQETKRLKPKRSPRAKNKK